MSGDNCQDMWRQYVNLLNEADGLRIRLLNECRDDLIALVKNGLRSSSSYAAAFRMMELLDSDAKTGLLVDLLKHACAHTRYFEVARAEILRLPRAWLMDNIETATAAVVENIEGDEFLQLLTFYKTLDMALAARLARWGVRSSDSYIRSQAEAFLRAHG